MRAPWDVLCDAGVPDGAPRPPVSGRFDRVAVRAALDSLASTDRDLAAPERECLGAWLAAFRRHWPETFDAVLGPLGESLLIRFTSGDFDRNRYLKLRRIATENLAHLI
jgi:hypothetical protein